MNKPWPPLLKRGETAAQSGGAPAAPEKRPLPRFGKFGGTIAQEPDTPAAPEKRPPPVPGPVSGAPDMGTLTLTVRIQPRLVAALRRATAVRRETRRAPYTQPAIVEEALARWLAEAGFLDKE